MIEIWYRDKSPAQVDADGHEAPIPRIAIVCATQFGLDPISWLFVRFRGWVYCRVNQTQTILWSSLMTHAWLCHRALGYSICCSASGRMDFPSAGTTLIHAT